MSPRGITSPAHSLVLSDSALWGGSSSSRRYEPRVRDSSCTTVGRSRKKSTSGSLSAGAVGSPASRIQAVTQPRMLSPPPSRRLEDFLSRTPHPVKHHRSSNPVTSRRRRSLLLEVPSARAVPTPPPMNCPQTLVGLFPVRRRYMSYRDVAAARSLVTRPSTPPARGDAGVGQPPRSLVVPSSPEGKRARHPARPPPRLHLPQRCRVTWWVFWVVWVVRLSGLR